MTQDIALDQGWAASACTLPTAEQPLRVAELDALFAEAVQAVQRPGQTRLPHDLLRIVGEGDGGLDLSASARYVRLSLTWRAPAYGYSLWELSVQA